MRVVLCNLDSKTEYAAKMTQKSMLCETKKGVPTICFANVGMTYLGDCGKTDAILKVHHNKNRTDLPGYENASLFNFT